MESPQGHLEKITRNMTRLVVWVFVAIASFFPIVFGLVTIFSEGKFFSLPLGIFLLLAGVVLMGWSIRQVMAENRSHLDQVRMFIRSHPEEQLCAPWKLSGEVAEQYQKIVRQNHQTVLWTVLVMLALVVGFIGWQEGWEIKVFVWLLGFWLVVGTGLHVFLGRQKLPDSLTVYFHPKALLVGERVQALSLWGTELKQVSLTEGCLVWHLEDADENKVQVQLPIPPENMPIARELCLKYDRYAKR
ncbi:MAG: hypothetical protein ACFCUI_10640 [Bernardetiaceae bacterium]